MDTLNWVGLCIALLAGLYLVVIVYQWDQQDSKENK